MPLSPAQPRTHLHTRTITLGGFQREDGLFDIEAEITDRKANSFTTMDRTVEAGTPLHNMLARLTVTEDLEIVGAEAATEFGPFFTCAGGAETFTRLTGLTIRPGFLKAANERLGGTIGCTHIRELLQQMATVAYQTTFPVRARRDSGKPDAPPRLLNTCHAYASDGPVVQRGWPKYYTGPTEA
jgi:hypothetical protein